MDDFNPDLDLGREVLNLTTGEVSSILDYRTQGRNPPGPLETPQQAREFLEHLADIAGNPKDIKVEDGSYWPPGTWKFLSPRVKHVPQKFHVTMRDLFRRVLAKNPDDEAIRKSLAVMEEKYDFSSIP